MTERVDLDELRRRLCDDIGGLAADLFGEPTSRDATEARFGRKGSLSVVIGRKKRGTWYNHEAGEGGDVFSLIQHGLGCSFRDALDYSKRRVGWVEGAPLPARVVRSEPDYDEEREAAEKVRDALRKWDAAQSIDGTPGAAYMAGRSITAPLPDCLRWLPAFPGSSLDHERYGCVVALATDGRGIGRAIQRVFLDGAAKAPGVAKKSRGTLKGAAVKFPGDPDVLYLAEGFETAASVWMATGAETWAVLGSAHNFGSVEGLDGRHVVLVRDGDKPDSPADKALAKSIEELGGRCAFLGLVSPPLGLDANDIHQRDGVAGVRSLIGTAKRVGGLSPSLPPFFDPPAGDKDFGLRRQRREIDSWFRRSETIAGAARDIDEEKRARWEAEGLTAKPGDEGEPAQRAAKAAITREVTAAICERHGLAPDDLRSPPRLLITGSQGSGKTRAVLDGLATLGDERLTVLLYQPTLDKAVEIAADYAANRTGDQASMMVVRGRGAVDPRGDGKQTMCRRAPVANKVAALGLSVREKLCQSCPFRAGCAYLEQDRAIADQGAGVFVLAHDYLYIPSPVEGAKLRRDIVVIDEDVTMKAVGGVEFAPSRIKDLGAWERVKIEDLADAHATACKVHDAVLDPAPLARLRSDGVTLDALKDLRRVLDVMAVDEVGDLDGSMSDTDIEAALSRVEQSELPKVARLVRSIIAEWDTGRSGLTSVVYRDDARVKVGSGDDARVELQPRVFVHYLRSVNVPAHAPVLLVDGTGSPELVGRVFGPVDHKRIAVERNAEVIQVTGKAFSRQSLTGRKGNGEAISDDRLRDADRLRADVLRFIRNTPGRVFVAATKQVKEAIALDLADLPNVHLGHFGALRGLNLFEDCETAIIIGREQPSFQALEGMARAFAAGDAEGFQSAAAIAPTDLLQTRARRMRGGPVSMETITVHPDPRAQAVLEQIREAEIVQAADRVRPVFNRRRIILLTNVVADVTVDRVMAWRDLRNGGSRFDKLAAAGLLPLSPAGLHAVRPDLWSTVKAADRYLEGLRKADPAASPDAMAFAAVRDGAYTSAEFRAEGAKRWSRLWFDAKRYPDPARSLSELFGCSVEVRGYEPPVDLPADEVPDVVPLSVVRKPDAASPPRPVFAAVAGPGTVSERTGVGWGPG